MPLTDESALALIRKTVKESIIAFAARTVNKVQKFQILDLIIPKERKIRSIVGGMETSLGTTLWEPLAKVLARENGFEVVNEKLECPTIMPGAISNTLQKIIDERKRKGGSIYDAQKSHDEIKSVCQFFVNERKIPTFSPAPKGRGVDIWLRKDGINYFFDTKTVQPNIGEFTAFMEQVLNWYTFFYSKNPSGISQARIVFPYNPYGNDDFWQNAMGKGFPLERDTEGWVENQFWDFCSGLPNTYGIITKAFQQLRESNELERCLDSILK